jgi:chromosome partitioning protein
MSSRTRIIAVANQKGGVGKSTTAVSLGAALAELGLRVLVIDLDPQGNASTGLGIRHEAREVTIYDVLSSEGRIREAIIETPVENLFAIPSTIDLAGAEIELVSQFSREMRLRKALVPLREGADGFDFVLLDCPPSLGLLTVNALAAAEELIVPIQTEYYALEGLGQLLRNVRLVQQNVNPGLRLTGIVMTMFDPRTKLSEQVVEEVRKYFGDLVYQTIIPRTVRLSEAPGFGQPITVYDPRSRGAESYRDLAREVVARPPSDTPLPVVDDLPAVILDPIETAPTPAPARAPRPLRAEPAETTTERADEEEPEAGPEAEIPAGEPPRTTPGGSLAEPEPYVEAELPEPVEPVETVETVEPAEPAEPASLPRQNGPVARAPSEGTEGERQGPDAVALDEWETATTVAAGVEREPEAPGDDDGKRRWGLFRRGGRG